MNQANLASGRNRKNLAPVQTKLNDAPAPSRWRRIRPVAASIEQPTEPQIPPTNMRPKPEPKLERTRSKMSLFNLFSKPNVEKARGHSEPGLAVPMGPPPTTKPSTSPPALKPNLSLSIASVVPPPSQSQPTPSLKTKSQKSSSMRKQPLNWDPPPLFQAYPQAIKHATVQACVFSPDILLRSQSQRKQYNVLREKTDNNQDPSASPEGDSEPRKLEKGKPSHKRLTSSAFNPLELTNKIYVLVTSGYVLQYSGEGPFDRLPEKILQLGKESAAFASDLIPGKHWVLQISQSAKEDGTISIGPQRSFLSRLRLQNASVRRTATSFLLVLESAEEMDSWLTTVRKEIDALGGMKMKDEAEARPSVDTVAEKALREKPSHRFLVQRDPNRFNDPSSPVHSPALSPVDSPTIVAPGWEGNRSRTNLNASDSASLRSSKRASVRMSMEASSIATTVVSNDQLQLNQLRESSRYSYISTGSGTVTMNTSRNSSPAPTSPLKDSFPQTEAEPTRSATSLRSFHMNPGNASTIRRRSMQTLPTTDENKSLPAEQHSLRPQRHSTFGPPAPRTPHDVRIPASAYFNRPSSIRVSQSPEKSSSSMRSVSAPPSRSSMISPPPRDPAPPPARPQSTLGSLPSASSLPAHSTSRATPSAKPFLRPLPIRTQTGDGSVVVPRRYSSLGPPIPLAVVVNRSVSTPQKLEAPQESSASSETQSTPAQSLRRPTSMQVKTSPAPFLLSARPTATSNRVVSSTPSFVPGVRASTNFSLHQRPSIPIMRQPAPRIQTRRSMPVIGLPPPAPPPNMPLPPPPPVSPPRPVMV